MSFGPLRAALHVRDLLRHPRLRGDRHRALRLPAASSGPAATLSLLGLPRRPADLRGELDSSGGEHASRAAEGVARRHRDPAHRPARLLPDAPKGSGECPMRFVVAALGLLVAANPAPETEVALTGFSPERDAWQRDYEKRFLALPQPDECGAILR